MPDDDRKVIQLNAEAGAFKSRTWLLEKVDATVFGLAFAADKLRELGADPEILRTAVWNALKVAAGLHGRDELFSPELAVALLADGKGTLERWREQGDGPPEGVGPGVPGASGVPGDSARRQIIGTVQAFFAKGGGLFLRKCPRCSAVARVLPEGPDAAEFFVLEWSRKTPNPLGDTTWRTSLASLGDLLDPEEGCGYCGYDRDR